MSDQLILLEGTLQDEKVIERLREMTTNGDRFHVVVPTRAPSDGEQAFIQLEVDAPIPEADQAATLARWRLRDAIAVLEEAGLEGDVDGEIGRADPLDAVQDAIDTSHYDRIVVVAGRSGIAGWLHMDVASQIGRKTDIPVVHLEAEVPQKA